MAEFEDELRKIKELGTQYSEKVKTEMKKEAPHRKDSVETAKIIKDKIKKIEDALTQNMPPNVQPFEMPYFIGETSGVPSFPYSGRVFLDFKTVENKIMVRVVTACMGMEKHYTDADPDLLTMITDQKISGFLNRVQEGLKEMISRK